MHTVRTTFDEVSIKGEFKWKEGTKKRQKTVKFCQTINPFNKGKDGLPKGRVQIMEEIKAERDAWFKACEKAGRGVELHEIRSKKR